MTLVLYIVAAFAVLTWLAWTAAAFMVLWRAGASMEVLTRLLDLITEHRRLNPDLYPREERTVRPSSRLH